VNEWENEKSNKGDLNLIPKKQRGRRKEGKEKIKMDEWKG
jgi:hypothetical protein